MAGPWIPAHWLRTGIPWARSFSLIGGAHVSNDLRLVRPAVDAGMRDTWVADDFGRQAQVAVTFGSGHFDAEGNRIAVAPEHSVAEAERFAHRARVGVRLADPHLLQIFETGDAKGAPFMVTELLEGKSLRHRLVHEGALSLPEARAVMSQIAGVLAKSHALQLAHGDIRTDHLFLNTGPSAKLSAEPFVKLSNFAAGLRLGFSSGEQPSSLLDHAYASPERLLRATGDDPQSDLWALAVTLYEVLTTTLPFEAPTPAGVAVAIHGGQFSPPSHYRADLPSTIDAWFARALARDPQARFHDPIELARSFELALDSAISSALAVQASSDVGAWSEADPDDDDGEEERTVKWDLPSDWSLGSSPSAADASLPPPLPDRVQSPRPPPSGPGSPHAGLAPAGGPLAALSAAVLAAASVPRSVQPVTRGGAFFTGDLARVARLPPAPSGFIPLALRPLPSSPAVAMAHAPRQLGVLGRGLVFGAALGAVSALALWIVQGVSSKGDDSAVSSEFALEPTLDDEGNSIARKPSSRRAPTPEELPRIIQTDDLPTIPDEPEGADPLAAPSPATITTATVKAEPRARVNSGTDSATLSPPPADKTGLAFTGPRARPAPLSPQRPAARPAPNKQAKAASSCNPPYFFDSNNIRRLKLECL